MWIFGKKANQQPATEVPPELQQYYNQRGVRLRQVSLLVLPVLAFLVILGVVLGGAVWLHHHKLGDLPQIFSRQTAKNPTPANPKNNTSSAQPTSPNNDQVANNQPSQGQVQAPGPSQTSTNSQPSGSASTPSSSSSSSAETTTTPTAIPSTGPSNATFVLAAGTAVLAIAGSYARQLRRANKI